MIDIYEEGTGKQPCKDIMVGKRTLVVTRALKKCNEEDFAFLESKIGNVIPSKIFLASSSNFLDNCKEYSLEPVFSIISLTLFISSSDKFYLPEEVNEFLNGLLSYLDDRKY